MADKHCYRLTFMRRYRTGELIPCECVFATKRAATEYLAKATRTMKENGGWIECMRLTKEF